jgi:hypothetical protein
MVPSMKACVGSILALVLLCSLALAGCEGDPDGAPVESGVVRAYRTYGHAQATSADCSYAGKNDDGSEWWWCDVEANDPLGADPCTADVRRRSDGTVSVRITYCIGVDDR